MLLTNANVVLRLIKLPDLLVVIEFYDIPTHYLNIDTWNMMRLDTDIRNGIHSHLLAKFILNSSSKDYLRNEFSICNNLPDHKHLQKYFYLVDIKVKDNMIVLVEGYES